VKKNCKLDCEVVAAKCDEEPSLWTLTLTIVCGEKETTTANAIISAVRLFATTNLPGITGYNSHILHTTFWDRNPGYKYKKVAVIGPGFSGAQPIPGLVRDARDLKVY